ncbi:NAD-dependent epimerase/dehydratase family protein [Burkholderia sp. FERM BP-3421]|uniref:NAD-dependent epimerase/dehydratase family protein n=1 Tax=Burkholderia sp. FERM BP-3421 TaxID=1494466 RepID=UPI002362B45F|nr:NAD-dependent epimerase/dehydratase family protein [Burkholderia sp. FERM BP-3421]WDD92867.1 NAD-dependent epimerase/dehydratase family protein [Burkholderia sp. FERM BP-3421]
MNIFVTGAGGFIGGSIAAGLVADGHRVSGLVRDPAQADALARIGVTPVTGTLDAHALLAAQAGAADAVVNAASSDHRGAIEALIDGLRGSGKVLLHTSGSSIVGDASGGEGSERIYHEDALPEPTPDKAARVALDRRVLAAAEEGVRSAVLCNTLIYGHGRGLPRERVQLPRLVRQARKSGIVRHVGRGLNIWSNVHIDDVVDLYRLALAKTPAGAFYFVENGEASYRDMTAAIAAAMGLGAAQDWPLADAEAEWGYEMANYGLGSNSRVRGERARSVLGWQPRHASVLDWIRGDLLRDGA